ncbi:MAG: RtcB family protein [Deltaproteobacteria bacterium]|jgi:release factor H-coupled RctB family protein|nr:RtcB family protein [Deltaproteobacteria bacterium]
MTVKIMRSEGLWLESGALGQPEPIDARPGMGLAAGLPDLRGGRSPAGLDAGERAWSVSRAAGRKRPGILCRERLTKKRRKESLTRASPGGRVVCQETEIIFQEAPEAHKNIESVIRRLEENRAAEVRLVMTPLPTFKG